MGMGLAMLAKALTNVHDETLVGRSRCTTGLDVANVAQVGLHRPRGAPTRLHQHGTRWDRATAPRESRQADAPCDTICLPAAQIVWPRGGGDLGFSLVGAPWWPTRRLKLSAESQWKSVRKLIKERSKHVQCLVMLIKGRWSPHTVHQERQAA